MLCVVLKLNPGKRILTRTQALVFYQPKRVAVGRGYPGSPATIDVFRKGKGSQFEMIDLDDEYRPGDLCLLETPVNPTGDSR
jgi:cystathionine gamma-synthase